MWIETSSFFFFLKHFSHPLSPSPSAPPSAAQPWLPIILAQTELSESLESENHLALFFWRSHGLQERGRAWTLVLLSLRGLGSHRQRGSGRKSREGKREKAGEGLNVVVGAEAGMCPLYLWPFVGAWWMRWVVAMTWLIAQTLNKSPILQQASPSGTPFCHCCQPTWADIVAGGGWRFSGSIVRWVAVGGSRELGMTVKMAGADTPHLQCSWHPNGWGVFFGPVVSPRGAVGRPALMRSRGVRRCWWGQHGSSNFDEVSYRDGAVQARNGVAVIMVLSRTFATCIIIYSACRCVSWAASIQQHRGFLHHLCVKIQDLSSKLR